MHSTVKLRNAGFEIAIEGKPATIEDLFPGFSQEDRLGVVVRRDFGAVGASTLILAAVTAFYEIERGKGDDFFIYPDYFLIHEGELHGDHSMLDVYRENKEFAVPSDPEQILRAINDRGITRLAVEAGPAGTPSFLPDTLAAATRRLRSAVAYSPSGRVPDGDVSVKGNPTTESFVGTLLDFEDVVVRMEADGSPEAAALRARRDEVPPETAAAVLADRERVLEDGVPRETFRRIDIEEALGLLAPQHGS